MVKDLSERIQNNISSRENGLQAEGYFVFLN
jgi:hypothetical protein